MTHGEHDLSVRSEELDPLADAARSLQDGLAEHGTAAGPDTDQAGAALREGGAASGPVLVDLVEAWRRQCQDLHGDCGRLSGHLDSTVNAFGEQDHAIHATFHGMAESMQPPSTIAGVTSDTADLPTASGTAPYRSPIYDWPEFQQGREGA